MAQYCRYCAYCISGDCYYWEFEWLTKTQGYSEADAKNMIAAAELVSKAEGD